MATLTYGPGLSLDGGQADNSLTGVGDTLGNFNFLTFSTETASQAIGDYRRLNNPVLQNIFNGNGFTYSPSGVPTGGNITEFKVLFNGALFSDLTSISVPVVTLEAWVAKGQYALAGATIFAGDDTIVGTSGNDTLDGYAGSNTLIPGTGIDTVIGGSGINTVILPDVVKEVHVSGSPMSFATVTGPDISDNLTSIDRVQFIDGTLYCDTTSPAAQIARMYQAAIGRVPDPSGLANWVATVTGGGSLNHIAASFIGSTEFQTRFPGASQNATALVTQLYANVLHRAPDSPGLAYWVGTLQTGAQSQTQVLTAFSESPENQGNMAGTLTNGIWVANEQAASVARLYYSALGRAPEAGGLIAWTNALESGAQTLQQEAAAFAGSPEFQGKYGNLTNADFVSLLYHNVLGRQAESAGLAAWTGTLDIGSLSRAGVLVGFSESLEHQILLTPKIEASGVILG